MKDGGPAFPGCVHANPGEWASAPAGMSLRDYFAAQAMAATIQRLGPIVKVVDTGSLTLMPDNPAVSEEDGRQIRRALADVAYAYADAMLAEREKRHAVSASTTEPGDMSDY